MITELGSVLLLAFIATCDSVSLNSLNGEWLVKDASGEYTNIPAVVPGGIYSDLMRNAIIGDIYYGYNDTETKWVPRRNWTYSRNFTVEEELLNNENINLVFEGLDTFATVVLNDVEVGESQNMFVRYIFDIKNALKVGSNQLEVRFVSPIEVSSALAKKQAERYVVPPTCTPDEYRGECGPNMLRKMQASYSWDWGPSFPSVGIWKDVHIEAYNEAVIRYVSTDVSADGNEWILDADIYLSDNTRGKIEGTLHLQLHLASKNIEKDLDVSLTPNEYGEIVQSARLNIPKGDVNAWWPNGYGGQDLYNLSVTFNSRNGEESTEKVRVGFRTIELIQRKINDTGLSFYFEVNGVPIFMKGSNEIPIDILPERGQDKKLIKTLLTTVKKSHMNMLRVWGGGVYESDYFYDLADEYGILIWQDFMFACAMYPTYDEYLKNVVEEVRHQVKRLRGHPSIALFAGNNENEAALRQNWYGTQENFNQYYNDYVLLYVTTIQTEFRRLTQEKRIYLSSSPSNGDQTIVENYVAQNPGDSLFGDVHFYNYVLNPWDSTIYPVSRFTSEYGYQSLPSFNSLLQATSNVEDIDIDSDFMDHRQHHPEGNGQMRDLIEFNLKLPDKTSPNYTKGFIYYLQIAQAVGIKIESEHYRRYRSVLNDNHEGFTMGALYWQLNDVWLAPTWAGIDFSGKWKMLQYFVSEFFAPVIITGHFDSNRNLEVYLVSDLLDDVSNVTAQIKVYNWNSLEPVHTTELSVDMKGGHSELLQTIDTDKFLSEQNCGSEENAKYNCFFYLSVEAGENQDVPNNYAFPAQLKNCNLQQANVKIERVVQKEDNVYEILVSTDKIALFVWLETPVRGTFTRNGFLLVQSEDKIHFVSEENTSVEDLMKTLTITNLMDEQYF